MSINVFKISLLAGMVLLLGTYIYLNAYKIDIATEEYVNIIQGKKVETLTLSLNGKDLAEIQLPSSDIFDAEGKRQVNFHALGGVLFQLLRFQLQEVTVVLDGKSTSEKLVDKGRYLFVKLPNKILYIVQENDIHAIAGLLWNERRNRKGVINCFGDTWCKSIHITGAGWGGVQGPFLDTDVRLKRRGMPRGRWGYGPETRLLIASEHEGGALLGIDMLGISPDQTFIVEGEQVVFKTTETNDQLAIGDKIFYPKSGLVKVWLKQGENTIVIRFSKWFNPSASDPRPLAAYITAIKIKELVK